MPFTQVPLESKKSINRAGEILISENPIESDLNWAREVANQWRACHAYPINTFQATLRRKLKAFQCETIIAQRLKRMPTIIDKLKRYSNMKLTTMQDIGGVRAVLGSIDEVYKLATEYKSKSRFAHELTSEYDYILDPRSEDGYRSLHLIYKYKNVLNPNYDGLRLELQIRTKLQHTWATAVETMGTFLGQALKSRRGDQNWIDFFAITSSAFAYMEKSPPIPRFSNLSKKETSAKVAEFDKAIGALEKMSGISAAVDFIFKKSRGWSYHLITLNSLEKRVKITAYKRENYEQALLDYSKVEKEASDGKKIEPVLVSAGPIDMLRRAYPNFFLDITDFVKIVGGIVSSIK